MVAAVAVACGPVHANTDPQGPSLEVPPPPAVESAPADSEPDPPAETTLPETAGVRPAGRAGTPPAPRPTAVRKPDKPEPVAPTTKPVVPAAVAAPSLQTTVKVGELEQKVRTMLARATRDLDSIDVRSLSADRRSQHDEARRFAEQAEAALKLKNLEFAERLAGKAAALADVLVKR